MQNWMVSERGWMKQHDVTLIKWTIAPYFKFLQRGHILIFYWSDAFMWNQRSEFTKSWPSNAAACKTCHMSLCFQSAVCIWMEINGLKSAVWPCIKQYYSLFWQYVKWLCFLMRSCCIKHTVHVLTEYSCCCQT